MNKLEKDENLALLNPETEGEITSDETLHADNNEESHTSGIIKSSRRAFMVGLGTLMLSAAIPGNAEAKNDPDTHYDKLEQSGYFNNLKGKKTVPEKMDQKERLLMNQSREVIYKHYLQFSFRRALARQNKEKETMKVLEEAIKNADKLHYTINSNGATIIRKRMVNGPNVSIKIERGLITEINGVSINHRDAKRGQYVRDFEAEIADIEKKVLRISPKLLYNPRYALPTETPPKISKEELQWVELYSVELPRHLLKIQELRSDLNDAEKKVVAELKGLLANHPEKTSVSKIPQLIVNKRKAMPKAKQKATPDRIFEILYSMANKSNALTTNVAYFSADGYFTDKDGKRLNPGTIPSKKAAKKTATTKPSTVKKPEKSADTVNTVQKAVRNGLKSVANWLGFDSK